MPVFSAGEVTRAVDADAVGVEDVVAGDRIREGQRAVGDHGRCRWPAPDRS